jgi:hypothetical protein
MHLADERHDIAKQFNLGGMLAFEDFALVKKKRFDEIREFLDLVADNCPHALIGATRPRLDLDVLTFTLVFVLFRFGSDDLLGEDAAKEIDERIRESL